METTANKCNMSRLLSGSVQILSLNLYTYSASSLYSCADTEHKQRVAYVCHAMHLIIIGFHAWFECTCWTYTCCRPVYCSSKKALPLEPGFVSETIYKDQVGSGWGVGGSAIWTLQEPKQGLSGSNASCFDLQTAVSDLVRCSEPSASDWCPPCPALPCPALPCPALPCPALPCPALPCPALPCPALPCPALPCPALPCPALPCPALLVGTSQVLVLFMHLELIC